MIPGTVGDQLLIKVAFGAQEVSVGSASVEDRGAVGELSIPLPGACGGLRRWLCAVHG